MNGCIPYKDDSLLSSMTTQTELMQCIVAVCLKQEPGSDREEDDYVFKKEKSASTFPFKNPVTQA